MIRYNYHSHTNFSDGNNTPEEMIQAAIAKGFHSIGISDHACMTYHADWVIPPSRMEEYLKTLRELQAKYADQIKVYVGLEQDATAMPLPNGLDYYIGSVHCVKKNGRNIEVDNTAQILRNAIQDCYGGDADGLAEDYYALVASYADDDQVAFIGHFDLITKFDEKESPIFPSTPRYTAAWQKAALRLIEAGKIFEINTGAIARGYRTSAYPCNEILQFLGEHGAKVVVSSDCHSADRIDCAFHLAEELICKYRLTHVELFA
ncbi:MAG: histidinol-phosphatase [Clostridia bacterium]|nr:histidinol-phosphatase [Clostridia bacterium]